MDSKMIVSLIVWQCFTGVVFSADAGAGENNDELQDRLAKLEATVLQQAVHQKNLESRLEETELSLKQQYDINAALMNRQVVADKKLQEAALLSYQLQQQLVSLENVTGECKSSALEAKAAQAALLRDARQSFVETVAFTAYLDHNLEHLGIDHPIVYNQVLMNEGGAYNPSNGMFVCPDDGFYVFFFQVSTNGVHQIVAKLVVNGVNQVDGISDTYHEYHEAQGGNMAVIKLTRGQSVWVSNYRWTDKSTQTSGTYRFATFSGFRIY